MSKGTYIRSLIRDIAYKLDTYGTMKELTRTGQGIFSLDDSYTLDDIQNNNYKLMSIKEALPNFNKKIKGFNQDDAIIAALESRTSSPVRIPRNEYLESVDISGLYPCGEGAGYAGGITTSAMDGLKVGEAIITKYNY